MSGHGEDRRVNRGSRSLDVGTDADAASCRAAYGNRCPAVVRLATAGLDSRAVKRRQNGADEISLRKILCRHQLELLYFERGRHPPGNTQRLARDWSRRVRPTEAASGNPRLIRTASRSDAVILGSASHPPSGSRWRTSAGLPAFTSADDEADVNRFICFDLLKAAEPKKSAFRQPGDQELESLRLPIYAIAIARAKEAAEASATLYAKRSPQNVE